eukprot:gene459-580_t
MKNLFIVILYLTSCIWLINGETFLLNADKCQQAQLGGCGIKSLLKGSVPREVDDLIVYTTDPAVKALVTISDALSCRTLNISNGILRLDNGANLAVGSDLHIGNEGTLSIASPCTVTNLLDSTGSIILDGGQLNVNGILNSAGSLALNSGTIETNCLQIPAVTASAPAILGGTLKLNGNSNIDSLLNLGGNSQLLVNGGVVTCSKGLNLLDTATAAINGATLSLTGPTECIMNKVLTIGPNGILNVAGPALKVLGGISNTDADSKINIGSGSSLLLSGQSVIPSLVDVASLGKFIVNNGQCDISNLKSQTDSLIDLQSNGILKTIGDIVMNAPINMDSTSALNIDNGVLQLLGKINDQAGSTINVIKGTCTFPVDTVHTVNSNINVNPDALLNLGGTNDILGNLVCTEGSKLLFDNNAITNLHGPSSDINLPVTLPGNSILNIQNGGCAIQKLIAGDSSIVSVGDGGNLVVDTISNFVNPLKLTGNAKLNFNGDTDINGIVVSALEKTPLPTLNFNNAKCILKGDVQPLGTIDLKSSHFDIAPNTKVILNNNLLSDATSNIVVNTDSLLNICGPQSTIDSPINLIGKLIMSNGNTDINNVITTLPTSSLLIDNANVALNKANSFVVPLIVQGTGSLDIKKNLECLKGLNVASATSPINIVGESLLQLFGNSTINSPVNCDANSILTIPAKAYTELNGGLNSATTTALNVLDSTCLLGGNSIVNGKVLLNGANLITSGDCQLVNGIQSITKDVKDAVANAIKNNLLVNSGSCSLGANSLLTGTVGVRQDAALDVNAPLKCLGGIKNSGLITVDSIIDATGSNIYQSASDAICTLSKGSQLIADTINMASGKLQGIGKIVTGNGCTCGGIVDGSFDVVGDLKLLDTSILNIDVNSPTDFNKIKVSANAYLNGLVDVNMGPNCDLKVGDVLQFLSASQCDGKLALSDSNYSKAFQISGGGAVHNLVYQTPPKESGKEATTGSASTLFVSSTLSILITFIYFILNF